MNIWVMFRVKVRIKVNFTVRVRVRFLPGLDLEIT